MLVSDFLHRRVRSALSVAIVALSGFSLLPAAAAGAQAEEPPAVDVLEVLAERAGDHAGRFDSPVVALLRAAHRTEQHRVTGAAAESGAAAQALRGCVDAGPTDADVPTMVAEIFMCRLVEAGFDEWQVRQWAAEALVVAQCESGFDPDVVVFDGRYLDAPHPNGNRYSAAGVFQLIRRVADRWIEGGYANVADPRLNIDAAARLFIHTRAAGFGGWEDWACASVSDGFKVGSVLPGWSGGPAELPGWTAPYVD